MKIAQVVCTLPPYGGGIGVVAHRYAFELSNLGHDVTVFKPRPKHLKHDSLVRNYKLVELRPQLHIGHGALLIQLLWRLRKFDMVHLHFPFLGAAIFVYFLKIMKGPKMRLVVSYHMDLVGTGVKRRLFDVYNRTLLKHMVKVADAIIASSFDYVENSNIQDYFNTHKEKFYEIPFGVRDAIKVDKKNPSLLLKYQISNDDFIVGFCGGLDSAHYFKGVNHLITAISKIDNRRIKALIVGEGNLRKKYMEQATELGVQDRVIFTGFVESELLAEHYNIMDVFILPSVDQSEAFGLVLVEAMACGKPLIASNLKGVRSVVVPGKNGLLVEPGNPADIVQKVLHLYEHPLLMKQFSMEGLSLVAEKYRWPTIAAQVDQVYQSLLAKEAGERV